MAKKQVNLDDLKSFVDSPQGEKLREYFDEKRRSLWSIYRLKDTLDPKQLTIQVEAMKFAENIITEILGDIMNIQEQARREKEKKDERDELAPGL